MTPQTLNPPRPEADAPPDLAQRFRELAERWRDETGHLSSVTKTLGHPAYQGVIELGRQYRDQVLGLLLLELRDRPEFWYNALRSIAGSSPVPESDRTDPERVREAWLRWGRTRG